MMTKCVVGIDIGTSGCKVILVDNKGGIRASASAEYPIFRPEAGWSEQSPEDWWQGVIEALKKIRPQLSGVQITGIGLSGQMHGMVALDAGYRVVRKAILWNDQRTQRQCDEITIAAGGLPGLLTHTNNMMLTGYTGGKILWIKQNEPENYEKTSIILNPKDYIRFMLTGETVTEVSDASGTGFFDVKNRVWADDLIALTGLKRSLFPRCIESNAKTGEITKKAAECTGLPEGTPVFGGGGDAVISSVGSGLCPGKVGITLGTSGVVAVTLPSYAENPEGKLQLFCANAPGTWMAFGCTLSAAGSYQWFKNALCAYESEVEKKNGTDAYDLLTAKAADVPAGSDGLIFLPYLTGERCPLFDPLAKGGFIGVTSSMHQGHFARAVMEGVGYSLKQVYDLIVKASGIRSSEIVVSGGGSKSLLWRKILADIFQMPVHTVNGSSEGGAFGAALIAGTSAGLWNSLEEAMSCAYLLEETMPNPSNRGLYEARYGDYCRMYDSLKWFFN